MKKLPKTLLITFLVLGVPMGAYAFSGSHAAGLNGNHSGQHDTNSAQQNNGGQHNQGGKHNNTSHHNMTPEQTQANLQQRYDGIADPAQKAAFVKNINESATAKAKKAEAMKTFAEADQ
ncbi:TPA: hypothetical protein ACSPZY_003862 [Aeromonas veronii]